MSVDIVKRLNDRADDKGRFEDDLMREARDFIIWLRPYQKLYNGFSQMTVDDYLKRKRK
jgi:hypothetical protein